MSTSVLYRIVHSLEPTETDFMSQGQLGQSPPASLTPEQRISWFTAISVFDTFAMAERMARRRPKLGSYIATLRIPVDSPIRRKGGPGHYDLTGQPRQYLAYIEVVVPLLDR